jgi:peptidoglycan-N-acetylglucosamine deacetylase
LRGLVQTEMGASGIRYPTLPGSKRLDPRIGSDVKTEPRTTAGIEPSHGERRAAGRRRRRRRRVRRGLALVLLLSFFASIPADAADLPAPIFVRVLDVVRLLPPDARLAPLAAAEGLRPRSGDFLDVQGVIIEPGRFPGHLTVNALEAVDWRPLRDGDVVGVVHGKDRTEGTVRQIVRVPGGRVANPQASLATAPGELVITKGRVSDKIVSSVFRPTGPYSAPLRVALTFDDGPSPTYTPQILDILERFDVKATFFAVGTMIERFPAVFRRVVREGHSIANHTYAHPIGGSFADRPRAEIRSEMDRMQRLLQSFGVRPVGFRPPGGSWSDFVRDEAEKRGMRTILWGVDSRDWLRPTAQQLVRRVLADARPGSIILLHDGGGDRSATVKALPAIIRGLRERGLDPVAIV